MDRFQLPLRDRTEAGQALADQLLGYANRQDVVVLALPRGGVLVGVEIAARLQAPLAVLLVRKLNVPGHDETPLGAVASGGLRFVNHAVANRFQLSEEEIEAAIHLESLHLIQRERLYACGRPLPELNQKSVILVDDGIASGTTMWLASHAVLKAGAREVILAVPILSRRRKLELSAVPTQVIDLVELEQFVPFENWYEDFRQPFDQVAVQTLEDFYARQPQAVVREAGMHAEA